MRLKQSVMMKAAVAQKFSTFIINKFAMVSVEHFRISVKYNWHYSNLSPVGFN